MRFYKNKDFLHFTGEPESPGQYNKRRRRFLVDCEINPLFRFDLAQRLPRRSRRDENLPRHKLGTIVRMMEEGFDDESIAAVIEEPVEIIQQIWEAEQRLINDVVSDYRLILRNL